MQTISAFNEGKKVQDKTYFGTNCRKHLPPTDSTFIKVIILLESKTKTSERRKKEK
jgi:hypothetical protein